MRNNSRTMNKFIFITLAVFLGKQSFYFLITRFKTNLSAVNSVQCDDSSEEILQQVKSKHLRKYLTDKREDVDENLEKLEKHCPGVTEKLKVFCSTFF